MAVRLCRSGPVVEATEAAPLFGGEALSIEEERWLDEEALSIEEERWLDGGQW
jgi:hypothetical protein